MTVDVPIGAVTPQFLDYLDENFQAVTDYLNRPGADDAAEKGFVYGVSDLDGIKALVVRPLILVVANGRAKGQWWWDDGSAATEDDALIVSPLSGPSGRYRRNFLGGVFPGWYGDIQGSLTNAGVGSDDAKAQLLAACQSGYPVDCRNLWWGIAGNLEPTTNFYGLIENFKFKQLTPAAVNVRTVFLNGKSNVILRNGIIDCNGVNVGTVADYAGIWAATGDNVVIDNVEIYNGGRINGIRAVSLTNSRITRPHIHNFRYTAGATIAISGITQAASGVVTTAVPHGFTTERSVVLTGIVGMTELNGRLCNITILGASTFSIAVDTTAFGAYVSGGLVHPLPSDDVMNAINLTSCTNVHVDKAIVGDLGCDIPSGPFVSRWTRGIAGSGNLRINVAEPIIFDVDQGIDFTGSLPNIQCHASDVTIGPTGSFGVKFANAPQQCSVVGGTISRAGLAGVTVSAGIATVATPAIDVLISDLVISDTGYGDLYKLNLPSAIYIFAGDIDNTFPRQTRIRNVHVVDTQASPTTAYPWRCDATPLDNVVDTASCSYRNCINGPLGFNTFSKLPSTATPGATYYASDIGTNGSYWMYDGTLWQPMNGSCVLATMDTAGTPKTNAAETIDFQYQLPAGLLQVGNRFRIALTLSKSGTTDSGTLRVRLGTAGTTADTLLNANNSTSVPNAANQQLSLMMDFRVASATSIQMLGVSNGSNATSGYSQSAAGLPASAVAISNVSNSLWLSVSVQSSGGTNTVTLMDAQYTLLAKLN